MLAYDRVLLLKLKDWKALPHSEALYRGGSMHWFNKRPSAGTISAANMLIHLYCGLRARRPAGLEDASTELSSVDRMRRLHKSE